MRHEIYYIVESGKEFHARDCSCGKFGFINSWYGPMPYENLVWGLRWGTEEEVSRLDLRDGV